MKESHQGRRKRYFFSIKTKTALLCICSILVAVSVTFYNMSVASKNIITESTEITLENLANTYSNNLADDINHVTKSANFMMSSAAISSFVESGGTENTTEVSNLATMFLNAQISYEDISIVDADGKVLYSSNSDLIGTDVSGETYFTNMVASGLSTQGTLYTSETSGEPCIPFAIPLRPDMGIVEVMPDKDVSAGRVEIPAGNVEITASGVEIPAGGVGDVTAPGAEISLDLAMSQDVNDVPPLTSDANDFPPMNNVVPMIPDANNAVPMTQEANEVLSITTDAEEGMIIDNSGKEPVGNFTGAIIISVKVSAFDKILSNIKVANYETGYAFILDSDGNVIYHPDESLIGTKLNVTEIDNLLAQVKSGKLPESNFITYTFNNVKKYASFKVNEDNQWIVFIGADQSEILKSLNVLASDTLLTIIILVLVISILAYIVTGRITDSIKKITKIINKTAELDFTDDKISERLSLQNDEIGEMSRAIEIMRKTLKNMILHLSNVSAKITESSNNLSTISTSVNKNAQDNSAIAEELSASMEEAAATIQQIHASIESIKNNSKDIADQVVLGAKLSEDIMNRAQKLRTVTMNATQKTQKIYEEVKKKTDAAIERSKAVEKINILSQTIKDIADQTNLLALNASIEAARAGESGSGFTVVAHEIGALANQSAKTVSHITKTVEEVYQAVANMSKSLEQTLDFLEKNVLYDYDTFLNSSSQYNDDAGVMSETMERIKKQIEQLNTNVLGIADSISEIDVMVTDAATGVNDVAEKNTDIVTLTSKTHNMSDENTELANGLEEIIGKFKL